MDIFVIGVSGPPGAGKSKFCATFGEYLTQLGRNVKYVNMDPACEVYLAFSPDWNITNYVKVADIQRDESLGFNGALLRAMEIMEKNVPVLLEEICKYPRNTFVMMDLPGQVELYTHTTQVKTIYEKIRDAGCQVCNLYLMESTLVRTVDFFIAYTANVTCTMCNLEVPQINLLTKVDQLILAKKEDKLELPFEFYRNIGNMEDLVHHLESDGTIFSEKHKRVISALAEVCTSYGLVDFMPCCLRDIRFLHLILCQVERALGYIATNREQNFKLAKAILKMNPDEVRMQDEVDELLTRCHKKIKKTKTVV